MTTIRVPNLDLIDLFGEDSMEIEGDTISLKGLLKKLTHKTCAGLELIHDPGDIVNEEYTILLLST